MARPKTPRNALLHALEHHAEPIYLLDQEHVLSYLNPAGEKWLGSPATELLGLRCQPSAVPLEAPSANLLRGLLPHPLSTAGASKVAAAGGGEVHGLAEVFTSRPDGSIEFRLAFSLNLESVEEAAPHRSSGSPLRLVQLLAPAATSPAANANPEQDLAAELRKLVVELSSLRPTLRALPGLAGKHPLTWRLRKQLESAGETRANVLICGPEKSLPELFAKAVSQAYHDRGVTLSMTLQGRLTDEEQLLECLRGMTRRLAAERNATGSLLLCRADQLPAPVQIQLRNWLQHQGAEVRIVSTSCQPLLELAATDQFDLELAARLSTQEINIPQLAERLGDLPAIATYWIDHQQAILGGPPIRLSPAVIDQLLEFEWTGDLEQLRSVLWQAANQLPGGGLLLPEHLPEIIRFGIQARRIGRPAPLAIDLDNYLETIERLLLERALQQARHNKSHAARLLGLTRQRFLRRCEHLHLPLPEEPIDFRPADDGASGEDPTGRGMEPGDS